MTNYAMTYYEGAYTQKLTVHFIAAVIGKRFCAPLGAFQSGPGLASTAEGGNLQTAGYPAAGGRVGGVNMYDVAIGGKGGVIKGKGTMVPVASGAAVAVGNEVQADATGRVIPLAAGVAIGLAHSAAGAADIDVVVELY